MKDALGGYFGLEISRRKNYHQYALELNTARNCLAYLSQVKQYTKIYIPYYTCGVIRDVLDNLNIPYEFYSIDSNLDVLEGKRLLEGEAFLYTNYFGVKSKEIHILYEKYGKQLIVDNAQAFFMLPIKNVDTFYSPRKFFGVPDGGYLYTNQILDMHLRLDYSSERMYHLLKRIDSGAEDGYLSFVKNEELLGNLPIRKMSNLTRSILSAIDYDSVRSIRRRNFFQMHSLLAEKNLLNLNLEEDDVPLVYPFLSPKGEALRKKLINNRVYVGTYWKDVLDICEDNQWEFFLAKNLLALPIDQRLTSDDILKIYSLLS